jgi:hypothetical protein
MSSGSILFFSPVETEVRVSSFISLSAVNIIFP